MTNTAASRRRAKLIRVRLLGVAFFLVLALFLWLTIAIYQKAFVKVVRVELVTGTIGNALASHAQVQMRGVEVGEVRAVHPRDGKVVVELALDPDQSQLIPSNVAARLLPKTVFGERYVDFVVPAQPAATHLSEGAVVYQDSSTEGVQLTQLLDDLLPLLKAVPPQDLGSTLGALAQGLRGKGERLGVTLEHLETIFAGINGVLPELRAGLRNFATTAVTYADAAPQLVDALDNLRTTNATVVQQRTQIDVLLATVTPASSSAADFLQANRANIIDLAADSRPILELLATYSPTFPCVAQGFAVKVPRIDRILGKGTPNPGSRVTIEMGNTRGRYLPNQDEPRWLDDRGPSCVPEGPLGIDQGQYVGGPFNDGSYAVPSRNPGNQRPPQMAVPQFRAFPRASGAMGMFQPQQLTTADSPAEHRTLRVIYAAASGVAPQDIPSWTLLPAAAALRGKQVSVR